jgi:hypothetical protein
MPTIEELFKSDQYKSLRVEQPNKDKSFGTQLKNIVLQDRLTGGPRTLLLKNIPLIYGAAAYTLERKLSNPFERGLAVRGAYYNESTTPAPLKGFSLGAAMGGTANRPSDTIFKNPDAPGAVNIRGLGDEKFQNHSDLINSIESGKSYWVSRAPAEIPWYAGALKGTPNDIKDKAIGLLMSQAKKEIGKAVDKAVTKMIKKRLDKKYGPAPEKDNATDPQDPKFEYYVPGYFADGNGNPANKSDKPLNFTKYVRKDGKKLTERTDKNIIYNGISKDLNKAGALAASGEKGASTSQFDLINQDILNTLLYENNDSLKKNLLDNIEGTDGQQTILIIKPYGKDYSIVFPGAITGISEDLAPEWTDFKYLGSPFKSYKYLGVERSLKFELKMYYTTSAEKVIMINKINSLKELVFPYDEITTIKYEGQTDYNQLAFSGNFIELSLGGLYKNMFGFIDSLSTSVEDSVVWASNSQDKNDKPYPSVVNISFGMKIIENHKIGDGKKTDVKRFNYDFDGVGTPASTIDAVSAALKNVRF